MNPFLAIGRILPHRQRESFREPTEPGAIPHHDEYFRAVALRPSREQDAVPTRRQQRFYSFDACSG
jgi:hypothetical protein